MRLRAANLAGILLLSAAGVFSHAAKRRADLVRLMTAEPHIEPESLRTLSTPTLVIAGSRDLIKRSHTELIARSIPGAELCILNGGHTVAADSPEEFNSAVHKFLQGSEDI